MSRFHLSRLLWQARGWDRQARFLTTSSKTSRAIPGGTSEHGDDKLINEKAEFMQRQGQLLGKAGFARTALRATSEQLIQVHVPAVKMGSVGAISVVQDGEAVDEKIFKNIDGHRFEDGRYARFIQEISSFIPKARQYTDPVRTFAYGTDASFYRLNPKLVVKVFNEEEVKRILPIAHKHGVPVTFRAAGTSLSGQSVTDSVLLKLSHTGKHFRNYKIHVRQ